MQLKTWNSNKIKYEIVKSYQPWIISYSWYCIKMPISLHCIILLNVDFLFCSIQTPLSGFVFLVWVIQITIVISSSCSTLACMLRGMDPTPHVVMPRRWRMWFKDNVTSVGLKTLGVSCKTTYNLFHSKFACLLTLAIAFRSLQWNRVKGLFKTCTFMAT
jgi:hypothetical protein